MAEIGPGKIIKTTVRITTIAYSQFFAGMQRCDRITGPRQGPPCMMCDSVMEGRVWYTSTATGTSTETRRQYEVNYHSANCTTDYVIYLIQDTSASILSLIHI